MAKDLPLPFYDLTVAEDEYIDMDVSSTTFLCYGKSSPPHSREFEFQMSFNPLERGTTTSPADELFYKGKLLPLHLPPRLQMVEKLLQSSSNSHGKDANALEENSNSVMTTATSTATSTTTTIPKTAAAPVQSCRIPQAKSCNVSGELSREAYMHECSSKHSLRKSWSQKFRQSSVGLKLKASKDYLKSLFATKPRCSEERNADHKVKDCASGYLMPHRSETFVQFQKERWLMADTNSITLMKSIEREKLLEEECMHRKSFSGAINCQWMPRTSPAVSSPSSSSSSSSFSSVNSSRFHGSQVLNRSSSVNSEMESSIQGAIAHCKKSQSSARNSVSDASDVSSFPLSASRAATACENQEKPTFLF